MFRLSRAMVQCAALIAMVGVCIHVLAIPGGAAWFKFFGAPPFVVHSAEQGTWIAPVGSLIIAVLMGMCAWYAAAVLGWVRRPPLHRLGLAAMACVCIVRGILLPVMAVSHPELLNRFEVIAAVVWFAAGVGFAFGVVALRRDTQQNLAG
ncbi:hypothetical protein KSF73_11585 [Burkholderiaceae bacterium DAT-1]|nr:hypothetical protein [Burkholderiaceae bacterium DAT-1]